ncbi:recombination protein Rad52 [Aspergillus uvarum CBS 121591]|uniref:Recombination protein Rad52 n=1 Tax=Aspergillus uvarum CBS 121591 TaxID=1448315 RepID=A0A319D737_9EURO|nr:recombination protein Rad52 [Aspergillus uvarum CBS 121591]PYH83768.1 recombination protein Rad52 [Aspergillus uvarum CBS 121591]
MAAEQEKPHGREAMRAKLDGQLGAEFIRERPGPGGQKLQYVSEADVIRIMNDVFGFDGYSTAVLDVPSPWPVNEISDGKWEVMAMARVRITVYVDGRQVSREAAGEGMMSGTRDRLMAMGKTMKEAETDALKRAFRQFGELLNCVYDEEYLVKLSCDDEVGRYAHQSNLGR